MSRDKSAVRPPPVRFVDKLKYLGPGLIISASIVGSGELIVTTKLGAEAGFVLLWFIILGCLLKVFVQIELGRFTLAHSMTTIEAMDCVPGPRVPLYRKKTPQGTRWVSLGWLVWIWLAMYIATFFQLAGIVGAIAQVFRAGGVTFSETVMAAIITGSCALFLGIGRYHFIERFSTIMVALFTMLTIGAVVVLHWTPYGITSEQLLSGFELNLPKNFTTAFAAFGIIGVGASELIYYPYWCLEKGYARWVGKNDGTRAWSDRATGWMDVMKLDAWVSMVIYTGATIAFYLLGAAVLNSQGLQVNDKTLINTLSTIYRESFGAWGLWLFLVGAFVVLYSTVFVSTASNGRLIADLFCVTTAGKSLSEARHTRIVQISCILLPLVYFLMYVGIGSPLGLVFVGALAQGAMLPFLCLAVLYFRYFRTAAAHRPGMLWTACLWTASILMSATGVFQIYKEKENLLSKGMITQSITGYGAIYHLPQAVQQPVQRSKVCVDLTQGSEPGELNPGLDKVARFVNIYRDAGKEPADVRIAVVLHDDATLVALDSLKNNVNKECLRTLQAAGVELYVCGQSLLKKGKQAKDVVPEVQVAVSALSVLVNLQREGFAYVPINGL